MEIINGGVCAAKGFLASGIHCGIRKNKEKRDKYQKEWRNKNKTHLKEYRQQRKEKEINDVFNEYYNYLQTID